MPQQVSYHGWVDLDFDVPLSLPISAWADGKFEEKAEKVGKMVERHKSQSLETTKRPVGTPCRHVKEGKCLANLIGSLHVMLQKQAGGGQEYGEELQQVLPLGDVPLDP